MRHRDPRPVVSLALLSVLFALLSGITPLDAQNAAKTSDSRMSWWREARFGLFIHWGLYATLEGEWKGGTDYGEWIRDSAHIPRAEYDELVKRFTAEKFDADRWASLAADAGMRYVVITTKHHDGFCLWKSDATDFDVESTPFGKDVMAEIARAFRAKGLKVCWYHSIMDWHHDDYLPRRNWEKDRTTEGADFARYVDYLHTQVTELLTRYGPIGVMWFDGEWESTWNHEQGQALYDLCRRLQPDVIVDNRVDVGRGGMAGMTTGDGFAGDFGTPEQEVPETGLPGVDWESCMTMNRHWGWNRADTGWKSPRELIRTLVDVASKGGNLLLNIGPQPNGELPQLAVERLEAIAKWMKANHDAIHGTLASPVPAPSFGRITMRRDGDRTTLYLCVFDRPSDGVLHVPGIGNAPRSASLLGRHVSLRARREDDGIAVDLPDTGLDENCTVVELELFGAPIAYLAPEVSAPSDVFLDRTEIVIRASSPELSLRFTADGSEVTTASPEVRGPIVLTRDTTIRTRNVHRGVLVGPETIRRFLRVPPRPAIEIEDAVPGLWRETFRGSVDRLPDLSSRTPDVRDSVADISLNGVAPIENVTLRFTGWFRVPEDGVYDFELRSDDGSRLTIDDAVLVDNDGLHGSRSLVGTTALAHGLHAIRVEWFNKTGGADLAVRMGKPGTAPVSIAADAFRRRED